jgi:hypothetical protein
MTDSTIGCKTCPMVVSSGFYQSPGPPPLSDACSIVLAHCRGHQNGQQSWSIFSLSFQLLLPWQPLGQYGASSHPRQRSLASRVALDMPYQAMPSVSLRRTTVAIEMANDSGACVCHCQLFCIIIRSYKTMLLFIKTNTKLQYKSYRFN